MELTAFMNWLLLQDDPVNQLIYEAKQQNPQVVDILELAGDATYDMETFIKAIDKLKELKEAETKAIPVELPVIARLELPVNTHLASQFVSKVKEMGAKIINVVEIKSSPMKPEDGILLYIIETDKEDLITDYAFYTWIRNENFQKYYKVQ